MSEPIYESNAPLTSKGNLVFKETTRLRFFGIPWPFTHYQIYENDLVVIKGLLNLDEDDCYLYKIADVNIKRSLLQRMFGLSTITCFVASDASGDQIELKNIKHGREIKDFLLSQSEACRLRRRTVATQNLSYHDNDHIEEVHIVDANHDGIPDDFQQ
ncbi:MAG: PH domain-containing protein [Butyrivibrio sp.]|uniref:PH domain-containing protein n=1 Tax=Butyrivibrio sp. TaxID=28121 RepID=UPI0025DC3F78|nr:PH domain-containing protein [Butyrivibrio sp.]MCR5772207.1 PH domain-containing protein [Butyrivibrio sp.]